MKLITNIKDYYDGAIQYSEDVVYRRLNEAVKLSPSDDNMAKNAISACKGGDLILGFCGKIYPFFIHNKRPLYFGIPKDVEYAKEVYYSFNEKARRYEYWKKREDMYTLMASAGVVPLGMRDMFRKREKLEVVEDDAMFYHHNVASFVYYRHQTEYLGQFVESKGTRILGTSLYFNYNSEDQIPRSYDRFGRIESRGVLIKNPILSDFGFHRQLDSYTATQEIEMYLGRLAYNDTPPMPVGSDKVIAESKGFDKYSFRKLPTKKKN